MSNFQWVYSSGQQWISFDPDSQQKIERLWGYNRASWIYTDSFPGPVYVDPSVMTVIYDGNSYHLARLWKN